MSLSALMLALAVVPCPSSEGGAAASASGLLVVLAKSAGAADFLDPTTGRRRVRAEVGPQPHEALVAPDGSRLFVSNYGSGTVSALDLSRLRNGFRDAPAAAAPPSRRAFDLGGASARPHGLAFGGGRLLVTAEGRHELVALDPDSGEELFALESDQEIGHMVALTPDGRFAFVANIGSGSVTRFDLAGRRRDGSIVTGAGAEGIAVSPDGRELWVTNRGADTVTVLSSDPFERKVDLECAAFPIRCAFTPDGKRVLVTCARSGEVAAFDASSRREVARLRLGGDVGAGKETLFGARFPESPVPIGVLVSPDGRFACVACSAADRVVVIDLASFEVVRVLETGREPDGLAWLPIDAA